MSQDKELHWTGFEPRTSDLSERPLFVSPLRKKFTTWAPIAATVVPTVNREQFSSAGADTAAKSKFPPKMRHCACTSPAFSRNVLP